MFIQGETSVYFSIKKLLILIASVTLISACGGGGSDTPDSETPTTPTTPTTYSVSASVIKGPVSGASCELFEVSTAGAVSTSIATGSTVAGLIDFGDSIEHQGAGLISCTGGTYTDEATGLSLTAPAMRAIVDIDGNGSFVVSPLTEIAVQRAGGNLNTALTTYNDLVADVFGLSNLDITEVVPTDLLTVDSLNDPEGEYAIILALLSQLNDDDPRSMASIIDDLAADLGDDEFADATLTSLSDAEANLVDSSEVASRINATALANITASAGIPDPDIDNGGGNSDNEQPNILVIISDDQGVDASAEYDFSMDPPNTPNISALATEGLIFQNAWASPTCAPTRAALLTGKHGVNNTVLSVPGNIREEDETIYEFLSENTSEYATAHIGKWHLSGGNLNEEDPINNGVGYFAGSVIGNIDNYLSWDLTINSTDTSASTTVSTEYNTTRLTELAEDWIDVQNSPWMMVLAYSAPHSPLHWPDESLHTRTGQTEASCAAAEDGGNNLNATKRECFLAMIEAMDTEIGNLLDSMTDEERDNTVVIYIGDNGTANGSRDQTVFRGGEVKNSLFEGGVRVPMVVSGNGVTRQNEVEDRLVTVTDIFATVAELSGSGVNSIYDSISFANYLAFEDGETRQHAYSDSDEGWTVRNDQYQLISEGDTETLYQINADNFNRTDVTNTEEEALFELRVEAAKVRNALAGLAALSGDFSMLDITEGGPNDIFTTRASTCARFIRSYTSSNVENAANNQMFNGDLSIELSNDICTFETNDIPNHDMQRDGNFANPVSTQNLTYRMTASPEFADEPTDLNVSIEQGIFLNGVKIDIFAAACIGIEGERTGCGNEFAPNFTLALEDVWRFDPMFNDGENFNTDINNAHTQPSGAYHYHGNPNALFDQEGNSESGTIGFAADGFPIYGSYIQENGDIKKVSSSYQVKQGNRPVIDIGGSSATYSQQPYDGTFRQDYEYVEGVGDLDECNGMMKDGTYGYYVTDGFPYVLGCYKGVPNNSF